MKRQYRLASVPIAIILLVQAVPACAADNYGEQNRPVSLSELAAKADLVAIAQVKDTDYVFTRAFPSEGSAFLRTLITYKAGRPKEDIFEVYEKGLHPFECYFENPTVFEEGRRYLVFLRHNPEDPESYRGFEEGCALEIFVTNDNRYALKYPADGIHLSDNLAPLVSRFEFRDNYAVVAEEDLSPDERDTLLAQDLVVPYQGGYKYTHGVDLTTARRLISVDALKPR
jgi:hypothetical protein